MSEMAKDIHALMIVHFAQSEVRSCSILFGGIAMEGEKIFHSIRRLLFIQLKKLKFRMKNKSEK